MADAWAVRSPAVAAARCAACAIAVQSETLLWSQQYPPIASAISQAARAGPWSAAWRQAATRLGSSAAHQSSAPAWSRSPADGRLSAAGAADDRPPAAGGADDPDGAGGVDGRLPAGDGRRRIWGYRT